VARFAPSVVFHLAAQPLVSRGYAHPAETFDVNVGGTSRLLEAVSGSPSLDALVVITTDKVYDPRQAPPHREGDFLGGHDPYSASKAATELLCESWPVGGDRVVTARAGNVIGGGDWAADRLLPDAMRAWSSHQPVVLRNPTAVRPWQHVLEPLRGYLLFAEHVTRAPGEVASLNFGPTTADSVPVGDIVALAAEVWADGSAQPRWHVEPSSMAEVQQLTIDASKAGADLGWRGALDWRTAVGWTVRWYRRHAAGIPASDLVTADLAAYRSIVAGGDR
jgi:CDP-glucose 4,6-dehydratase